IDSVDLSGGFAASRDRSEWNLHAISAADSSIFAVVPAVGRNTSKERRPSACPAPGRELANVKGFMAAHDECQQVAAGGKTTIERRERDAVRLFKSHGVDLVERRQHPLVTVTQGGQQFVFRRAKFAA